MIMFHSYRNEAERKLIEFVATSKEAHREVRMAIVEKMVQMHNGKRWHRKLIGVQEFIERYGKPFFFVCEVSVDEIKQTAIAWCFNV